jgi:hypothetical protein
MFALKWATGDENSALIQCFRVNLPFVWQWLKNGQL